MQPFFCIDYTIKVARSKNMFDLDAEMKAITIRKEEKTANQQ